MARGNKKIEAYVPVVRLNEGIYSEYDIATTGALQGATFKTGTSEAANVKGFYLSNTVAVAVPSITDPDIARVQVDVSAALTMQPAVGDAVIAIPQEALPTAARLQGAWVYQTDGVEITFGSEGGNVTGGNKNFKFLVIDLT